MKFIYFRISILSQDAHRQMNQGEKNNRFEMANMLSIQNRYQKIIYHTIGTICIGECINTPGSHVYVSKKFIVISEQAR